MINKMEDAKEETFKNVFVSSDVSILNMAGKMGETRRGTIVKEFGFQFFCKRIKGTGT